MDPFPAQRPGSIRSVASNSSIASGVSLARRPRTRTRSRTVTGGSMRPEDVPQFPASSDLPYLSSPISREPVGEQATSQPIPLTAPPLQPPRSPQIQEPFEIRSSDAASSQGATADLTIIEPLPPLSIGRPVRKSILIPFLESESCAYQSRKPSSKHLTSPFWTQATSRLLLHSRAIQLLHPS